MTEMEVFKEIAAVSDKYLVNDENNLVLYISSKSMTIELRRTNLIMIVPERCAININYKDIIEINAWLDSSGVVHFGMKFRVGDSLECRI